MLQGVALLFEWNTSYDNQVMVFQSTPNTVPYQKYSYPTKYPCSDCAIYRLNIQFGAKMEIEIYRHQKLVVLALTWVEFFCFKDIP